MKLQLLMFTGLLLAGAGLYGQAPVIEWQQTYTTSEPRIVIEDEGTPYESQTIYLVYESLSSLIQTSDGNYAGFNGKLLKFDASGALLLNKEIDSKTSSGVAVSFVSLIKASDNGFILIGYTHQNRASTSIILRKVDEQGNNVWEKSYRGADRPLVGNRYFVSEATSVIATKDGGYLIGGYSNADAGNDKSEGTRGASDYWIIKVNSGGTLEWEKTIGGNEEDGNTTYAVKVAQASDGSYLVLGGSESPASGDKTENSGGDDRYLDSWVVKLNNKGILLWEKTLGSSFFDIPAALSVTTDGGCMVAMQSNSPASGNKTSDSKGDYDIWLVKLNADGIIEWDKTIGGDGVDAPATISQETDGGYLIGGTTSSGIFGDKTVASLGEDYWILKLNATGTVQWQMALGGQESEGGGGENLSILLPLGNGNYMAGGYAYSGISGNKTAPLRGGRDIWLVKLKPCPSSATAEKTVCPGSSYSFGGTTLSNPGVYNGTFTNIHGCDSVVALTLKFFETPAPVVNVQEAVLSSAASYGDYQWLLNGKPINGATNAEYTATENGLYQLVVITADGCKDTSSALRPAFKTHLFVPNVFSPNGDAKNDVLKVYGNQLLSARLMIFNQWGQKIFETRDATQTGWDGRSGGRPQPAGVYAYVLEATLSDGKVEKKNGSFTLVR